MRVKPETWAKRAKTFYGLECSPLVPSGDLQKEGNSHIIKVAKVIKAPLLLTLDSHFVRRDQKFLQDIVLKNGSDDGWHFYESYNLIQTGEAWARWARQRGESPAAQAEFIEAVESNQALVDMVGPIKLKKEFHLPEVDFPIELSSREDLTQDQRLEAYTMQLIAEHGRFPEEGDPRRQEYIERLRTEIKVIVNNGTINFLPYFIVLQDICRHARENGILVGCGRGSAAGSLLAYLLKVTHVDPIFWNLSFARFLSMGRIKRGKFPDIDLDFGDPGAIADWLKQVHGDKFIRICTTGTAKLKGALRDVSRVLLGTKTNEALAAEVDAVCKTVGVIPQGMSDTKKWLYGWEDGEGAHPGHIDENPELRAFLEKYPEVKAGVDGVLDIPRSLGRHASAYCLADVSIEDLMPTCIISKETCTQFTMGPVEAMGLVKFDLLGLNTLKDIAGCVKLVKERTGTDIDIYALPDHDEATMKAFCDGNNETVFQFGSEIGVNICKQIGPAGINDLSDITANGRPGTMYALMEDGKTTLIDAWIARRQGKAPVTYVHPDLSEILSTTCGIFVYQEQIMAAFVKCCGFSEERADEIREVIGKKKKDKMDELLPVIREALAANGWDVKQIDSFISLCIAASSYSFNKSHSLAYAYLGYVCQYLKTHYPLEWWTSVLQNCSTDDLKKNSHFCRTFIVPPDINQSDVDFYIIDGNRERIVYPIGMVRGVKGTGVGIVAQRPFSSLGDFYARVDRTKVHKGVVSSLIYSGAFDSLCGVKLPADRNRVIREYYELRGEKKIPEPLEEFEILLKQNIALPLNSANFSSLITRQTGRSLVDLSALHLIEEKQVVRIGGVIERIHKHKPKKEGAKTMAFVDLMDSSVAASVTVFSECLEKYASALKEGAIVMIDGKINNFKGKVGVIADKVTRFGVVEAEESEESEGEEQSGAQ